VALLVIGTFAWVYGFNKKKVDHVLQEVAAETGLSYIPSWVSYARLEGPFSGYETEVSVRADREFGLGAITAVETGLSGLAAMDIHNYTGIRMHHGLDLPEEIVLSKHWPRIITHSNEAVLAMPHVSRSREEIVQALQLMVKKINQLTIK